VEVLFNFVESRVTEEQTTLNSEISSFSELFTVEDLSLGFLYVQFQITVHANPG